VPSLMRRTAAALAAVLAIAAVGAGSAATVRPAAGRERITFHTLEVDGGLRVLPSDAVPLLAAGKLDSNLFDVNELIADGYGDATSPSLPLIVTVASTPPSTAAPPRSVRRPPGRPASTGTA
jgi:hypothetical protein